MKTSLIEFSLKNYKIFKEKMSFSMASPKNAKHTFPMLGENLLRTSFIYGPNASGKSSILDGFRLMRKMIVLSANKVEGNLEDRVLEFEPFLGDINCKNAPTTFGLIFLIQEEGENSGIYEYSFSFNANEIIEESLKKIIKEEYVVLFDRKKNIDLGEGWSEVSNLRERTRKDALFISVAAQFNWQPASVIVEAVQKMNCIRGTDPEKYSDFTQRKIKDDPAFKEEVERYLKSADFCITKIEAQKESGESPRLRKIIERGMRILFSHPGFDGEKEVSSFELPMDKESEGTQRFLKLLGPIIDTLNTGKVLWIDEFDSSLHPLLVKFIATIFDSSENKHGAQLIATTHDTTLLSCKDEFIKRQFWFTDKDRYGAASLFSLAEFKFDLRNDTEYGKKYLLGRFGALPLIDFKR
jgi:uncharacterized protein